MKSLILLVSIPVTTFANNIFDNSTWYSDSYYLTTNKTAPINYNGVTYDHALFYTVPNGDGSSDLCHVNNNTLTCLSADNVAYDADKHKVFLSGSNATFTYYEKGWSPKGSPLSGTWVPEDPENHFRGLCNDSVEKINIPYYESVENTRFDNIFDGHGCCNTAFLQATGKDNQLVLNGDISYHLYDKDNNPIFSLKGADTIKLNDSMYPSQFDKRCNYIKK